MKCSAELAEKVVINTLQSLEQDYEMEIENEPVCQFGSQLAITDGINISDWQYIDTNSNGSIEEIE